MARPRGEKRAIVKPLDISISVDADNNVTLGGGYTADDIEVGEVIIDSTTGYLVSKNDQGVLFPNIPDINNLIAKEDSELADLETKRDELGTETTGLENDYTSHEDNTNNVSTGYLLEAFYFADRSSLEISRDYNMETTQLFDETFTPYVSEIAIIIPDTTRSANLWFNTSLNINSLEVKQTSDYSIISVDKHVASLRDDLLQVKLFFPSAVTEDHVLVVNFKEVAETEDIRVSGVFLK